jgi:hypothetical protein
MTGPRASHSIPRARLAAAAGCRWLLDRDGNFTDQYTSSATIQRLNRTTINDLPKAPVHPGSH